MRYTYLDTPIGKLLIAGDDAGLRRIAFDSAAPEAGWQLDPGAFVETTRQLHEYFARRRQTFDLPLAPEGTAFQRAVWEIVRRIAYGQRATYGDLAGQLDKPGAARAVGAANACNPLPIVIPCHRVVGSGGALTGYAGGLEIKRQLLQLEQSEPPDHAAPSSRASA
ncbi:MAG: methylated-DNA--[protein]-cysteine S-methyltransferase [Gemmataceae bacterium]